MGYGQEELLKATAAVDASDMVREHSRRLDTSNAVVRGPLGLALRMCYRALYCPERTLKSVMLEIGPMSNLYKLSLRAMGQEARVVVDGQDPEAMALEALGELIERAAGQKFMLDTALTAANAALEGAMRRAL